MVTPDSHSRRLQIVDEQLAESGEAAAPNEELAATSMAAFVALIADADQSVVERTLDQMNAEQLRSLAIALATQLTATANATGETADVGPDGICTIAIATAAQSFGTSRSAVLSADRHRTVTDARAVAMTAARRAGLTLPTIAVYFGKDHTSVMYAANKVANNPRLNAVCAWIVDQLDDHFAEPTSISADDSTTAAGCSSRPQVAAIKLARDASARGNRDEDSHLAVSAAPTGTVR